MPCLRHFLDLQLEDSVESCCPNGRSDNRFTLFWNYINEESVRLGYPTSGTRSCVNSEIFSCNTIWLTSIEGIACFSISGWLIRWLKWVGLLPEGGISSESPTYMPIWRACRHKLVCNRYPSLMKKIGTWRCCSTTGRARLNATPAGSFAVTHAKI